MNGRHYIVPTALVPSLQLKAEWHATSIPADPTQSLLSVDWGDNHTDEDAFEALPEVLFLGERWEPCPDVAIPLLASFQADVVVNSKDSAASVIDPSSPPVSVAAALRKTGWPMGR